MVPGVGSVPVVETSGKKFPGLRYVITGNGFLLKLPWRTNIMLHYVPGDLHDSRLTVHLFQRADTHTEVRAWLSSGPFGVVPNMLRLFLFMVFGTATLTDSQMGPLMVGILGLGAILVVASWWVRFPLNPVWGETFPLIEALETIIQEEARGKTEEPIPPQPP